MKGKLRDIELKGSDHSGFTAVFRFWTKMSLKSVFGIYFFTAVLWCTSLRLGVPLGFSDP